jgi:hypothetical protein
VSAYIGAPPDSVYEYIADLKNLDEWTLSSRMKEQIDEDTWLAASSGYQNDLYYHIRKFPGEPFRGIEWHCGTRRGDYFQVYPTFLFRPSYVEPGSEEPGVYFHWMSFIDPARRTPMIEQGIRSAHVSECRGLKAALERRARLTGPASGKYQIKTATIYVDSPIDLGVSYVSDLRNMTAWSHLTRVKGEVLAGSGEFVDEYDRPMRTAVRTHSRSSYYLIEHETYYPSAGVWQETPSILIPCSYALGNPDARGFILQRVMFWEAGLPPRYGKPQIEDHQAELINIKRILEASAGNLETFARGTSYLP